MDEIFKIEFSEELDLHHFHPKDVKAIVEEYLQYAAEKGYSKVKIIHGKGRSVIKSIVHSQLLKNEHVRSFHDDASNWGATIVYLRQK